MRHRERRIRSGQGSSQAARPHARTEATMEEPRPQVVVVRPERSVGVAYALLIFGGSFGLHRFYLNRIGTAIAQLALGVAGWATVWFAIGFIFLVPLWIWLVVDLFLTGGMVRKVNQA